MLNLKKCQKDLSDEQGVGTTFAMFMAVVCIMTGGLAIDASNLYSVKQRLQSATDVAAHAAILRMIWPNEDGLDGSVSDVAIASLLKNMPESKFGVALQESDVNIGYWDATAKQFTATSTGADGKPLEQAVSVTSRLDGEVGNVVPTFILDMVGFDFWKVSANAIFVRDTPNCFEGGFIAEGFVNLASNNEFVNGFCIHGNEGVDVNSHNSFGSGVVVSMPDSRLASDGGMFDLKGTGHTWADGYDQQVANQYLTASLASVESLTEAINALTDTSSNGVPPYITVSTLNNITVRANSPLQMSQLVPNAVNVIDCPNRGLDFPDNATIENMVIIADCKVNFGQDGFVRNATIVTTDTGNQSFNSASGLQLGEDDSCLEGGGVTLMTMGEAHFSAQTEWYGVELYANGDVHISAQADGIEGVHIQSAGDIFATSNLGFGSCNKGLDHYREMYVAHMVR